MGFYGVWILRITAYDCRVNVNGRVSIKPVRISHQEGTWWDDDLNRLRQGGFYPNVYDWNLPMNLSDLGWNQHFARHFEELPEKNFLPARIIRQDRQQYIARTITACYTVLLPGNLIYDTNSSKTPAVGDWVAIEPFEENQGIVRSILPRLTTFARKEAGSVTREQILATNIDTAFIVCGLDHDFNPRRIERFVVQTRTSGATPVLLLNKADLCSEVEGYIKQAERAAPGVEVIKLSARYDSSFDRLRVHVTPGKTVVFLGSSGVGKSTIINRLLGHENQSTGTVRAHDSRGRHTTTHRELILLPEGGMVIDSPGLREIQLWSDPADLEAAFSDIEGFAHACRFRDCTHVSEPGCAVRLAIEDGRLDRNRYQNFLKLMREIEYLDQRKKGAYQYEEKRRAKEFGRFRSRINRHNPKNNRSR